MALTEEMPVQDKQEIGADEEGTLQARYFVPQTDIFEDAGKLTVVMELPGVSKENLSVDLENDRLSVQGKIDFSNYEGLEPVYTEYNIGHYTRGFAVSSEIDRNKITADLKDGVLTLVLPKAKSAQPKKIKVQ